MNVEQVAEFFINVTICAIIFVMCWAVVLEFVKDLLGKGDRE